MELTQPRSGTCRIIIDSCSDFPREMLDSLHVDIVNFEFIMQDGPHKDDFWESMAPEAFYDRLRSGETSSTSAPLMGGYTQLFTACAQEGTPTIFISFPAALSVSFDAADTVAKEIREQYPDFELHVIDSYCPSVAAMPLIMEAVRLRNQGLSATELADWVKEARYFVNGAFTIDSLDHLSRGGRIPVAAAQITGKLDLKASLSYDLVGALTLTGVNRGRKKALRGLVKSFMDGFDGDTTQSIIVADGDCEKDAELLIQLIKREKRYENLNIIRTSIGPVIGSHVGPDMIAIVYWGPDRRESGSVADRIAGRVKRSDR